MTDDPRRAGPGGVLELPLVVIDELLHAVPRLVERTQSQVGLARTLAGRLPCLGGLLAHRGDVPVPAHEAPQPVDVLSVVADDATGADVPGGAPADGPATDGPAPAGAADGSDPADGSGATGPTGPPPPSEDELPVPDYDSLAASQVVPRLAALSPEELGTVRSYEQAHRRRMTILNRVDQLLAD